jgi:hypothetical protein
MAVGRPELTMRYRDAQTNTRAMIVVGLSKAVNTIYTGMDGLS